MVTIRENENGNCDEISEMGWLKKVLVIVPLFLTLSDGDSSQNITNLFAKFIKAHGKYYELGSDEYYLRLETFKVSGR